MKKNLFVILLFVGIICSSCYKEDIEDINNRLEAIENTQIATINQQISSIRNSIDLLGNTDKELKTYITALEKKAEQLESIKAAIENLKAIDETIENRIADFEKQLDSELKIITATIEELKAKDKLIESKIAELKEYINSELKKTEDWATGTFATLEQYNSLTLEIASLKTYLEEANSSFAVAIASLETSMKGWVNEQMKDYYTIAEINDKISSLNKSLEESKKYIEESKKNLSNVIASLETSMKEWINDQLSGYYTIAEIEAKLEAIKNTSTGVGNDMKDDISNLQKDIAGLQKEIEALEESLASTKNDLISAYQNAILEAIDTNNGLINAKIANEINVVNDKLTSEISAINNSIIKIEERLKNIESRLSAAEDAIEKMQSLDIIIETSEEIACMPGTSVQINYTITGGDTETAIEAWGDGGWSAHVIREDAFSGKIKVTAPDGATNGKIIVLATSGAGGVKMKTIHFVEGVLGNINDTYEVEWEKCVLEINLQTNLNYTIYIPEEAKNWISLVQTRSEIRNETLILNVEENPEETPRSTMVEIIGECGDILQRFEITQKPQPSDGYIEFADKYAKVVCISKFDINGDNEISFKEASKVTSIEERFFGDYAEAITSFDELQHFVNIVEIKENAFRGCTNLKSIMLPEGIDKIDDYTFYYCTNLVNIIIPIGVTTIGESAFYECGSLLDVTFPNSVTTIKESAFMNCHKLRRVYIPNSVTKIDVQAFRYCNGIENITIPNGTIEMLAFAQCDNLKNVTFGDGVTKIGNSAFGSCKNLTTVTIGSGINSIEDEAFNYCQNMTAFYCKAINPPTLGDDPMHYDFYTPSKKCTFYVPKESVWLYKTTKWKVYADFIEGYDF